MLENTRPAAGPSRERRRAPAVPPEPSNDRDGTSVSDVERIDIELLTALDVLLATRNVTRAAEQLGMSQPALSARLTRLRDLFADRLFIPAPSGRGVVPTPRALALAPMVSRVLDQMRAMLEPANFNPTTSKRTFTIALHENPP